MIEQYQFHSVERFSFPSPIPYVFTENHLPRYQKILVFLPHSDDGRYIGCSLHFLNRENHLRIVVISPGYRGVDNAMSDDEKTTLRWNEARHWAEKLGFDTDQIVHFEADRTYRDHRIHRREQERLFALMEKENPTAVFLPHISDTAQPINYHTREMVLKAVLWLLERRDRLTPKRPAPLLLFEYPTNHVPLLPPSDRNFMVFFQDPDSVRIKHEANKAHVSQRVSCFDIQGRFTEAIMAITESDMIHHASKGRRLAECLSGVRINPHTSRGEQFGVTKIGVYGGRRIIIEERLKFPLNERDRGLWVGE
jgi:LmbE family N-acetylglucosaminyl deacetylase